MFIDVYWCLLMFIDVYWCLLMFIDVYWCLLMFIVDISYIKLVFFFSMGVITNKHHREEGQNPRIFGRQGYCHCSICRRLSGAPFSCQALFTAAEAFFSFSQLRSLFFWATQMSVNFDVASCCWCFILVHLGSSYLAFHFRFTVYRDWCLCTYRTYQISPIQKKVPKLWIGVDVKRPKAQAEIRVDQSLYVQKR